VIMHGRAIAPGTAEGEALVLDEPFSFLGGADGATGDLHVRAGNLAGKVFVFPKGKGSTVGSFVMYDLKVHGKAPAAVVNQTAETIVTTGAVIASIPMADQVDVSLIREGDRVIVDGKRGYVELPDVQVLDSVSSVILTAGKVLMLCRPPAAHSFPGVWSLVSGKVERGETPEETARREIKEETGLTVGFPDAAISPVLVREGKTVWRVWPFLFRAEQAKPVLNRENTAFQWVAPAEVSERPTVAKVPDIIKLFIGQ